MAVKHRFRVAHLCSSVFICGSLALNAHADVKATDAWVRGTVPAQRTTGAFVTLESSEEAKVVGVKSSVAKTAEIHSSAMKDGVMHMQAIDALALPAGKRVTLEPGGLHVMLMGLAKALGEGDTVPLTFTIEDRRGKRTTLEVKATVRPLGK
jgi:copper(I)-binding protein